MKSRRPKTPLCLSTSASKMKGILTFYFHRVLLRSRKISLKKLFIPKRKGSSNALQKRVPFNHPPWNKPRLSLPRRHSTHPQSLPLSNRKRSGSSRTSRPLLTRTTRVRSPSKRPQSIATKFLRILRIQLKSSPPSSITRAWMATSRSLHPW